MTMKGISHHRTWMGNSYKPLFPARWALVIVINGVITPYTWPFKWVTVVVTHPRRGVVTLLITTVVGAHPCGCIEIMIRLKSRTATLQRVPLNLPVSELSLREFPSISNILESLESPWNMKATCRCFPKVQAILMPLGCKSVILAARLSTHLPTYKK